MVLLSSLPPSPLRQAQGPELHRRTQGPEPFGLEFVAERHGRGTQGYVGTRWWDKLRHTYPAEAHWRQAKRFDDIIHQR